MTSAQGSWRNPPAVCSVVVTIERTARGIAFPVTVRLGGRTATLAVFEASLADEPRARRRAEACAIRTARALGMRASAPLAPPGLPETPRGDTIGDGTPPLFPVPDRAPSRHR